MAPSPEKPYVDDSGLIVVSKPYLECFTLDVWKQLRGFLHHQKIGPTFYWFMDKPEVRQALDMESAS